MKSNVSDCALDDEASRNDYPLLPRLNEPCKSELFAHT